MKIGTTRVETFSDGVIAIIITIMVLSLKFPDINQKESAFAFRLHLKELLPFFTAYVFSFMMIGIYWINHHHMFHLLEKTDEGLLILNLFFLFWMSLIPLGTALLGANLQNPDSIALYGFLLLMTTLTFAIMKAHTMRKKLVHTDRDSTVESKIRQVSMKARTKSFAGAGAYLCAVVFAYINIYIAYAFFLVPPLIFFIPDGIDDEKLAEKIEEKNG